MAFQYSLMEKFYDWVGIDAEKNSCFFTPSEIRNYFKCLQRHGQEYSFTVSSEPI